MNFVVLFGRPAVGKSTVARELGRLTGYRVLEYRLLVDTALAVYEFGSPEFIALRETLSRAAFAEIARDQALPGLIFTFTPENSIPQKFVDDLFETFAAAGVTTPCVELVCRPGEVKLRLARPERREKGKLTDPAIYQQLHSSGAFDSPIIRHNRLVIDTSEVPPPAAAEKIAAHLRSP